ncbi:MAG TPA: hypothetical protein VFX98_01355, partial [Longimicrobiaceae bacterium]|nr:hypothetical protein [Longimicrobiaceae bacterium]
MSGDKSLHTMAVDLAKGYALSEFFPLTHPTLTGALLTLSRDFLTSGEELRLDVGPGGLRRGAEALARRSPHVERFATRLAEHGVTQLALRPDVGAETLGRFLSAVALPPRVARAAGGLPAALAAANVSRV